MTVQHNCNYCGKPMKIKSLQPGERPPKHVEGKGTFCRYICTNVDCVGERDIFRPYKGSD